MNRDNPIPDWRRKVAASPLAPQLLSEEELARSVARVLRAWDGESDIWLFAYGSLIWNPQVKFAEQRVATVYGYHRRFCLWSRINRGTPERPGLVLGLDRGGSCSGLAYRIAAPHVERELIRLWEREMLLGSYHATWARCRTDRHSFKALTFVVNRGASGYTGRLSETAMVEALETACGRYGTCADYLMRTAESLAAHGIKDRQLMRLNDRLRLANR